MLNNAKVALPGRNEEDYESIITRSVDHISSFLVRNLCGTGSCCKSRDIVNEEVIDSIIQSENTKGAVVVTSHQGDWENLIQYFRKRDDLFSCNLYRKPRCKVADRLLHELRGISQHCSGYGIMKQFRKVKDKKVFALIGVDQKPINNGVTVDFLNRPTVISPVSVQIALKTGVPLIIAKTLIKDRRTEISFRKVEMPDCSNMNQEESVQAGLQAVMNEIGSDIEQDPEQWVMWSHDFWRQKNAA